MIELGKLYDHQKVEAKWREKWGASGLFCSNVNKEREPYTILMPPPNITGILHMGHVLNNTIQDILARRARMLGKEVCWVPGLDHASIATEARVVSMLKSKGIDKASLSREEFLQYVWEWKEKYGSIIIEQLKSLGISCDWSRLIFSMQPNVSQSVQEVFMRLYEQGYIYKARRMINWDPQGKTAISDDEVIYKEVNSKLYFIKYEVVEKVDGKNDYIVIATTRPETILGDSAVCVNPSDERYKWLTNKNVIVPLINKVVPVIEDQHVEVEFGTGCLKVTPAHDEADYMLASKHGLEVIEILNDNATIGAQANMYVGLSVAEARAKIVSDLQEIGALVKVEDYKNNIGFSERTNAIVESRLSTQWFVKMWELAQPALSAVMSDDIKFYPPKFKNIYKVWMSNIKDWCISRQLWWGHRIPAYYLADGTMVVARTKQEALDKLKHSVGYPITLDDIRQDEDVLDTWFSAWLWPIVVFNGILEPHNPEIEYYYPTNDLVTAPEIIFFWVARMVMSGYKFTGKMPFKNVYFTGIVRDQQARKMSKSLGNSPDPLELISEYGADAVRFGIMLSSNAGNDLLFDVSICEQGKKFVNKVWNALKLVTSWQTYESSEAVNQVAIDWFKARINSVLEGVNADLKEFRLSSALMQIYKLFWDDFCSYYLEMIKPIGAKVVDRYTYESTVGFFEDMMKLLHPFMPFVTEEVWQTIGQLSADKYIMANEWPNLTEPDADIMLHGELAFCTINKLRNIRAENYISNKVQLKLLASSSNIWIKKFSVYVQKMANVVIDYYSEDSDKQASNELSFEVGNFLFKVVLDPALSLDKEKELKICNKELEYLEGFLASVNRKLENSKFVENAPADVINN
jgi:valyl-tRNA synthetase